MRIAHSNYGSAQGKLRLFRRRRATTLSLWGLIALVAGVFMLLGYTPGDDFVGYTIFVPLALIFLGSLATYHEWRKYGKELTQFPRDQVLKIEWRTRLDYSRFRRETGAEKSTDALFNLQLLVCQARWGWVKSTREELSRRREELTQKNDCGE